MLGEGSAIVFRVAELKSEVELLRLDKMRLAVGTGTGIIDSP